MTSVTTAPLLLTDTVISEEEKNSKRTNVKFIVQQKSKRKYYFLTPIVWLNVLKFILLHATFIYGIKRIPTFKLQTVFYNFFLIVLAGVGITGGAHRLWAHKAFNAKWPLRLILAIGQTLAMQNSIHEWVRDHRVHHKFTDTHADPHDSRRGFFFSHMGWLMMKKHWDVTTKGKQIDMSDLEKDPIVNFQKRHYIPLVVLAIAIFWFYIPYRLWNETLENALLVAILRYTISLHFTWLVNSAAHIWGTKPYDRYISPTENKVVSMLALGEGFHNYHHTFPWDYKAGELGYYGKNWTTCFLDFFSKIGWAYNLKAASHDMIWKRIGRTGDGGYYFKETDIWGWDDVNMSLEEKNSVEVKYEKNE